MTTNTIMIKKVTLLHLFSLDNNSLRDNACAFMLYMCIDYRNLYLN